MHDYHKNLWTLLKRLILLKNAEDDKGSEAKQQCATQSEEFGYKYIRKSNDPILLIKGFIFTSASLALLLLTLATVNALMWNSSGSELKLLSNKSSETKHLEISIKRINAGV